MRRLVPSVVVGALAVSAVVAFLRTPAVETAPAVPAVSTQRPAPGEPIVTRDPALVFQRAFWRRPAADSRVLHGERREWLDASSAVRKWDWFIAVQTSADFRIWLLEQSHLELTRVTTPPSSSELASVPDWFPAPAQWPALTAYRSRSSRLFVLLDPTSGQLFAADQGSGFASAVR